jgi:hypothetical protein
VRRPRGHERSREEGDERGQRRAEQPPVRHPGGGHECGERRQRQRSQHPVSSAQMQGATDDRRAAGAGAREGCQPEPGTWRNSLHSHYLTR